MNKLKSIIILLLVVLLVGCGKEKEVEEPKDVILKCVNNGDNIIVEAHSEIIFEKVTYKIISGKLDFIFDYKDMYTEQELQQSEASLKERFCSNVDTSLYPATDCKLEIQGTRLIGAATLDQDKLAVMALKKENTELSEDDINTMDEYMKHLFGTNMICERN